VKQRAPETCPVCGEDVPPNALACPECGADHNSGWREDADSIDSIGAGFGYDEDAEREEDVSPGSQGVKPVWWITAIVLLVAFIAFYALAMR
jgi:hypothetical protein